MAKTKLCRGCYQPFVGRRGALTCSPRCRKRLQRTRQELANSWSPPMRGGVGGQSRLATSKQVSPRFARLYKHGKKLVLLVFLLPVLLALASTGNVSAAVSQGYVTDDPSLREYMAVTLNGDNSDGRPVVESSSTEHMENALGVAINLNNSLLAVSPLNSQVYVVTGGPVKVYVSDLNGLPHRGDLLAISPLRGILMRSTDSTKPSFGVALEDFNGVGAQEITVKDSKGNPIQVKVATIQVNIAINPPLTSNNDQTSNWLSNLGSSISGRQISSIRVLAALAIFFTLMVVEGEIIYSTVSSSITALGRNPLAKSAIIKHSLRSVGVTILILVVGIWAIAMLIWL